MSYFFFGQSDIPGPDRLPVESPSGAPVSEGDYSRGTTGGTSREDAPAENVAAEAIRATEEMVGREQAAQRIDLTTPVNEISAEGFPVASPLTVGGGLPSTTPPAETPPALQVEQLVSVQSYTADGTAQAAAVPVPSNSGGAGTLAVLGGAALLLYLLLRR